MWRAFFDGAFSIASLLLIVFFGAALGNVMRGVPLGADHYFFVPLWTDFRPGAEPGMLDWYTLLCAIVTLAALSMHGALYLILKTEGALNERMRRIVKWLWPAQVVLSAAALVATMIVRPATARQLPRRTGGLDYSGAGRGRARRHRLFHARGAGAQCISFILPLYRGDAGGAAYALYPALLPSSGDPANSLTIRNAAAGAASLSAGIGWWMVGMLVAVGYFVVVYRMFRGKVTPDAHP